LWKLFSGCVTDLNISVRWDYRIRDDPINESIDELRNSLGPRIKKFRLMDAEGCFPPSLCLNLDSVFSAAEVLNVDLPKDITFEGHHYPHLRDMTLKSHYSQESLAVDSLVGMLNMGGAPMLKKLTIRSSRSPDIDWFQIDWDAIYTSLSSQFGAVTTGIARLLYPDDTGSFPEKANYHECYEITCTKRIGGVDYKKRPNSQQ
jgi:hypothetical protein